MTQALNRRTVLAGAAAIPVASLPALALANQPDPVFAALKALQEADAYSDALLKKADGYEEEAYRLSEDYADTMAPDDIPARDAFRAARWTAYDGAEKKAFLKLQSAYLGTAHWQHNREKMDELQAPRREEMGRLREEASDTQSSATWALVDTVPTTAAGAIALLDWYRERDRGWDFSGWTRDLDDDGEDVESETLASALMATVARYLAPKQA